MILFHLHFCFIVHLLKSQVHFHAEIRLAVLDRRDLGRSGLSAGGYAARNRRRVTAASGSGGASVGAAVDVGNIKTQTNAFLGDGNKVASGGSVTVEAKDNMHGIMSNAISAAIGFVGLSGSISVYNVGSTMSPEDQATLSGQTSEKNRKSV